MALHRAKCNAFQKHCNVLRRAIQANLKGLSYKLYTENLIGVEVRDCVSAEEIVCILESRLKYDERAWDTLIEVLRRSDECAELARTLTNELSHGQRPSRGESKYCVLKTNSLAICRCCVACTLWANKGGSCRTYLYTHSLTTPYHSMGDRLENACGLKLLS